MAAVLVEGTPVNGTALHSPTRSDSLNSQWLLLAAVIAALVFSLFLAAHATLTVIDRSTDVGVNTDIDSTAPMFWSGRPY